ncbi:MAG: cytochrome c maturation protein CcmE [Nitrospirae bacterium]|nr:cytochrome c maturation protein CcmE [Nitrospirota bacterium]
MKKFYLRWSIIFLLCIVFSLIAGNRYLKEVAVISPDELEQKSASIPVRVQGRIEPGSLQFESGRQQAIFELSGSQRKIPVLYTGDDLDNLREFKVVVLVGTWDSSTHRFESRKMALTPNYGFITAAYFVGLIPLLFFLFKMERKVVLLYDRIKEEKVYQSEESG